MFRFMIVAGVALAFAPLAVQAQVTYRCTTKEGKKYYGSTIPMQCAGLVVEQLNAQGRVVKRIDPEGEAKERAEKAAAASKNKEEEAVSKEEMRRNRALLATYTSEKDIEDARQRALADNEKAVSEVAAKIEAIKKTRAKYEKELEFYQDKKGNSKPPPVLASNIKNAEIDLKAQEDLLAAKKKEVATINAKYDEDKKRYMQLKRGGSK